MALFLLKMFPDAVGIIRQFTFSSKLQRMSVVTRQLNASSFELYAKGSPEMIVSLSNPETSTTELMTLIPFSYFGLILKYLWRKFSMLK